MNKLLGIIICVHLITIIYMYVLPDPDKVPYMFRHLVPKQFHDRLFKMSDDDRNAVKQIIARHNEYKNINEALNALKIIRPSLYNLSIEIKEYIDEKLSLLEPEAKKYITKRIDDYRKIRPTIEHKTTYSEINETLRHTISDFIKLPESAKESIRKTFPNIMQYVTSPKFKKLVKGMLDDINYDDM
uniref:Fatty-acid and retinol-binding protein 1 n=1 Tax=Parastrongyloides trichosuri TaxID=131310 RepID=A0A0N4ZB61_PARTI